MAWILATLSAIMAVVICAARIVLEKEYGTWAPAVSRFIVAIGGFVCPQRRKEWLSEVLVAQKHGDTAVMFALTTLVGSVWLRLSATLQLVVRPNYIISDARYFILIPMSSSWMVSDFLDEIQRQLSAYLQRHPGKTQHAFDNAFVESMTRHDGTPWIVVLTPRFRKLCRLPLAKGLVGGRFASIERVRVAQSRSTQGRTTEQLAWPEGHGSPAESD